LKRPVHDIYDDFYYHEALMKKYNVTDGKMLLTLEEAERGWYVVTSPSDPALITQARTIREAFEMARDAQAALAASRRDLERYERARKQKLRRTA
jgi:predicted RNase H-like HicB family nuclease